MRISLAAAMTLGLVQGKFFRDSKLHCLNILLTYSDGCAGSCAYCGLARNRQTEAKNQQQSFIRVDWPTVQLDEVLARMNQDFSSSVERTCISMVTNSKAKKDTLSIIHKLCAKTKEISVLIAPTIVNKSWLIEIKAAGADKVGIAIDTAMPDLFEQLRGKGVKGPHGWNRYWKIIDDAVEIFGRYNVGIHLIVGLGETEKEIIQTIQLAHEKGVLTHLFSFFAEEGSLLQDKLQPPIGKYRRVQLARYLINKGKSSISQMAFDDQGRLARFNLTDNELNGAIDSGLPFMTSGCSTKKRDGACNRPFGDYTPYQAYIGEMRNYPFVPSKEDVAIIRKQLWDQSDIPVKVWTEGLDYP